jgi:hypothetical protein
LGKTKRVTESIIKIDGEATLEEIYSEIPDRELFVEPLSKKEKLSCFILEGGLGYNSLKEGTFSSKIFRLKVSSPKFGTFQYGLDSMGLYNVGYPLHRIVEGYDKEFLGLEFHNILEVTVPVRAKEEVKLCFLEKGLGELEAPLSAENVFFINGFGANLMGLPKEGCVITYKNGLEGEGEKLEKKIWAQRFLLDKIEKTTLRVFAMRSKVKPIYDIFLKAQGELFFALLTHLGVLVVMSGDESKLEEIFNEISDISMKYGG